jgi:hypothetical protein
MQASTTLKKLLKAGACEDRYKHLKKSLGKGYGDNTPIDLVQILDTNGLYDVLWIPRSAVCGDYIERRYRLFAVACCQDVLHLMKDQRSLDAVKAAHLYAYDEIDDAARAAAGDAAWAAVGAAAWDSAWDAAWAAAGAAAWDAVGAAAEAAAEYYIARAAAGAAAWDAAWAAAGAAAWDAARNAARAAAEERQSDHFRIIFSEDFK